MESLEEILANTKLDPSTGCRIWLRWIDCYGYGQVWWQGGYHRVHRVVWELLHGSPEELDVLHTCDNRPCCEPMHLFLGTQLDNVRDCVAKGRRPRGDQHGWHRLTEAQVVQIKRLLTEGKHPQVRIASMYGTYPETISAIARNRSWKHIPWPKKKG